MGSDIGAENTGAQQGIRHRRGPLSRQAPQEIFSTVCSTGDLRQSHAAGYSSAFPSDGGYSTWFEGRVVDMLYFPLFSFYWPEWIPGVGGTFYEFFAYIFQYCRCLYMHRGGVADILYSSDLNQALGHVAGNIESGMEGLPQRRERTGRNEEYPCSACHCRDSVPVCLRLREAAVQGVVGR